MRSVPDIVPIALFSVNVGFVLATVDDASVWPTHYSAFFFMALGFARSASRV